MDPNPNQQKSYVGLIITALICIGILIGGMMLYNALMNAPKKLPPPASNPAETPL